MRPAIVPFLLLVVAAGLACARPAGAVSNKFLRNLQQTQTSNCTAPRTPGDASKPFCYVPPTASLEARSFLATASASAGPFGNPNFGTTPAEVAAAVAKLRAAVDQVNIPFSEAAKKLYLDSVRNDTIGGVPVLVETPKGVDKALTKDSKILLYLHGGGYIFGSCGTQLHTPAATAAAAGLTIICPEYRLAPEHPFPAGLNDALAVYKGLLKEGYKPSNIVVLGDSAGGGMAAALAIQLQREGEPLPAAMGLFSPFADMVSRGDTIKTLVGVDPLFLGGVGSDTTTGNLTGGPALYLANNASLLDDPLASPVLADFVRLFPNGTLPPTLIQVGLREVLLSDAVRLYHKMKAAAPAPGHVVISPYEGMWHVFQLAVNVPEAAAASREMADYFARALKGHICK